MKKNVQDMIEGKTLKTWVWEGAVVVLTLLEVVVDNNTLFTLKAAFLAEADLKEEVLLGFIFDSL